MAINFSDVPQTHWAADSIQWAAENGLVRGDDGKDTFRPDDSVSRAELVTVLKRYDDLLNGVEPVMTLKELISSGEELIEIEDPDLELSADIHPNQVLTYFQIGNYYLALALRPSLNTYHYVGPLEDDYPFAGILISSKDGEQWEKFLQVNDTGQDTSNNNNPYYLWLSEGRLHLSVVDTNGAGSGEGKEKVFYTTDGMHWEQKNECYYFGDNTTGLVDSTQFGKDISNDGYFKASIHLNHMATDNQFLELGMVDPKNANQCFDDVELVAF